MGERAATRASSGAAGHAQPQLASSHAACAQQRGQAGELAQPDRRTNARRPAAGIGGQARAGRVRPRLPARQATVGVRPCGACAQRALASEPM